MSAPLLVTPAINVVKTFAVAPQMRLTTAGREVMR